MAPWNSAAGLNDGTAAPFESAEGKLGAAWGTWPQVGEQTVTLTWAFDATLGSVGVWWFADSTDESMEGMIPPRSWVLQWLDGTEWKDVVLDGGSTYARERGKFNRVDFAPVTTKSLRIVAESWGAEEGEGSAGILEWQALTPTALPPTRRLLP
ncbi:hypothetical protein G7085_04980 [Tessaracoccus sp. HDW20]|uniref:hypothetical protein n=1 Tax=Tessaracoccus coleopterorum TaxID=2714950 RepID=UPI0018D3480F|nr:hypothetical protein [Tessaracoccus coleopterorum]NHB84196.1 hypothetical protein [Tessaracoccus coleopterorum]